MHYENEMLKFVLEEFFCLFCKGLVKLEHYTFTNVVWRRDKLTVSAHA